MTDTDALMGVIKKSGLKIKYIAECLGLSYYGLKLKINNQQEFKTSEVTILCKLLGITSLEEKEKIFFTEKMI